jgi:hypothetical protein
MAEPKRATTGEQWTLTVTLVNGNPQVSNPNLPINFGDTVVFQNSSGGTLNVYFRGGGTSIFNNVVNLANGQSSAAQYPNQNTVIADYGLAVDISGTNYTSGPFCIAVEDGALPVTATNQGSGWQTNLDSNALAIPAGHAVTFTVAGTNLTCAIAFNPSTAFSPSTLTINSSSSPAAGTATAQTVAAGTTVTFTMGTSPVAAAGMGTIKVGSVENRRDHSEVKE